jgi:hypothetical protein
MARYIRAVCGPAEIEFGTGRLAGTFSQDHERKKTDSALDRASVISIELRSPESSTQRPFDGEFRFPDYQVFDFGITVGSKLSVVNEKLLNGTSRPHGPFPTGG